MPPRTMVANRHGTFSATALGAVRGEKKLFSGLDFRLPPGGALVLTGPNGSGKSSLLRLMAGFGRPVAGHLAWDGADVARDPEAHRLRLHYVGHQDGLKPALTVAETLRFWAALGGVRLADPAAALAPLGLAGLAGTPCRFLSSGQRRRLALSRLSVGAAPLWLLDEPAVGLDAAALGALSRLIRHHRGTGGSIVLSTHQGMELDGIETISLADFPWRRADDPAGLDW
jgi:heme exporter protein A